MAGAEHPALDAVEGSLSYEAFVAASDRYAHRLRRHGVGAGDRVALLLHRATESLPALLAVATTGATAVPLAADAAPDAIRTALAATGARIVLTTRLADPAPVPGVRVLHLDVPTEIAERGLDAPTTTLATTDPTGTDATTTTTASTGATTIVTGPGSPAFVVLGADGTDDTPRAIAIGHAAALDLVSVVAELAGVRPDDRIFHDPRTGSDLAVLETWLAWARGATVVTPPGGADLRGPALGRFLREHDVTVLRADPDLLAGVDPELPRLRLVLLSGTARPRELLARWHRPGRRLLGLHGPPETTVAALWCDLDPEGRSPLGAPLPTYRVIVLDPDDPTRVLPTGEIGEIAIGGPGVAAGYLGHPEATREAFVPSPAPSDVSGPVFRTGDLGRMTAAGEVEHFGRLDDAGGRGTRPPGPTPVRPLAGQPAGRVFAPRGTAPGRYVRERPDAPTVTLPLRPTPSLARAAPPRARGKLDAPTRLLRPAGTPATAPARRAAPPETPLAAPSGPTGASEPGPTPSPAGGTEATSTALRELLAGVLGRDTVGDDAHFFDDLGADSMLMARFCAKIRKHPGLPAVAMQDIYQHTTLAALAAALGQTSATPGVAAPSPVVGAGAAATVTTLRELLAEVLDRDAVPDDAHFFDDLGADSMLMARFCAKIRKHPDLPAVSMQDIYQHTTLATLAASLGPQAPVGAALAVPAAEARPRPVGRLGHALCGLAQLLIFLGYTYLAATVLNWGFEWLLAAPDLQGLYVRAVAVGSAVFVGLSVVPIALKWVLWGRFRPREFRVWGLTYLRFWVVKTLVGTNPLAAFAGTPIFPLYLRALGARVGRGTLLLGGGVPVAADLLTVGDRTVVRKDVIWSGYRAHDGLIQIGPVTVGSDVVIGENAVLDIDTAVGDGGALGHASALHRGQSVPAGESWHGSPARPADFRYPEPPPARCGALRKVLYSLVTLTLALAVLGPLLTAVAVLLVREIPWVAALLDPGAGALTDSTFWVRALVIATVFTVGALFLGLLIVATVPRLLDLAVRPERVYPLYGVLFWLHRTVAATTNVKAFTYLFGDASAIAHYLSWIGYRLRPLTQTGSNFGMSVKHENPYLTTVGAGTVVADGLSIMNAEYSATSFTVSPVRIGARNFLGNRIAYPAGGRTGDDCLLATKVMVPIDGPVRTGVGLLGSPSFEIPRTVSRDSAIEGADHADPVGLRRALRRKNRHNAVTMVLYLLVLWYLVFGTVAVVGCVASVPVRLGAVEMLAAQLLLMLLGPLSLVAVERVVARLAVRAPEGRSIYHRDFLRHERYWKVATAEWMQLLNGTPFKSVAWRLLGVRIGARVFDDGVNITERPFTTIGSGSTLAAGTVIQCHSQEDGAFKSDHVVLGERVTLGVGAFVHYGTTIGDDAVLAPDTFLMKGEEVPAGDYWGGNPARPQPALPSPSAVKPAS